MMNWVYLGGAIAFEIFATSMLKLSNGFTKPFPTIALLVAYAAAFYCLSLALRGIPMGIAYAIWCGVGIIAISLIGLWAYGEGLDLAAIIGIGLILAGTVIIKVFSKSAA